MSRFVSLAFSVLLALLAIGFVATHGLAGSWHDVLVLSRHVYGWVSRTSQSVEHGRQ